MCTFAIIFAQEDGVENIVEMSKVGVVIVGDGNQDGVLLCVEGHKVYHNGMGRGTVIQGSELRMIGEVVLPVVM